MMRNDDLGCDYSDEPRTDGKSSLDLFRESCEAADRALVGDAVLSEVPPLAEVFAALDGAKIPHDFLLTEADRDRRPAQERPELDKMLDALEGGENDQEQDGTLPKR